ncbi:hypothetical protein RhiLY_08814 [Ceratobasidium sp. AG-Ba]|nr:hypothetical protein RhiLY_08814 [Ceratobasidium sp. AG-Ba]
MGERAASQCSVTCGFHASAFGDKGLRLTNACRLATLVPLAFTTPLLHSFTSPAVPWPNVDPSPPGVAGVAGVTIVADLVVVAVEVAVAVVVAVATVEMLEVDGVAKEPKMLHPKVKNHILLTEEATHLGHTHKQVIEVVARAVVYHKAKGEDLSHHQTFKKRI